MAVPSHSFLSLFLVTSLFFSLHCAADPVQVSIPSKPPNNNVVQPNFLGISFELSFMAEYFGNDTYTIPNVTMNYLAALRSRYGGNPVRIRVGGNSMDSSIYVSSQGSPMVQLLGGNPNANNQPVQYGPVLWDVMSKVATDVGGAQYLVGLSLLDPNNNNNSIVAGAAQKTLGDNLDGFLLGNEPDLYTSHGNRPNLQNYTVDDYIGEFRTTSDQLTNTSAGDILSRDNIGGPTICCDWNLDAVLNGGYLTAFNQFLKYISLQHYPQNNCFGNPPYGIPYYVQHANAVDLAAWQKPGIDITASNTSADRPELIMSEFNSVSCGGIPGVSDTFGVGSLWTIDYALQLASVGYSAAYLHTRERGISYNLFTPPDGPNGIPGPWTTNSPYYALLTVAEALQSASNKGSIVADLNVGGSMTNVNSPVGGYAIYDAKDSSVQQIVLINFANTSSSTATFALPSSAFISSGKNNVTVKYLAATNLNEKTNIAWGGETLATVGDGKLVPSNAAFSVPNKQTDCSNGCSIDVPSSALAVVFASSPPAVTNGSSTNGSSTNSTGSGGSPSSTTQKTNISGASPGAPFFSPATTWIMSIVTVGLYAYFQ